MSLGLLLGGAVTDLGSWRWTLFINIPIGIAVLSLTRRVLVETPLRPGRFDVVGALAATLGSVSIVWALIGAPEHGWGSARTIGGLALGGLLLVVLALTETRVAHPMIQPVLLRSRRRVSGLGIIALVVGGQMSMFFLAVQYLEGELGFGPLTTGLAFLPLTLVIGVSAHAGQRLLGRLAPRSIISAGLVTVAGGYLLLAQAPAGASYMADLLPGFLLIGAGIGLVFVAVSVTGMSEVEHRQAGLASGLMTTGHEVGAALGAAVFSAVALGPVGEIGGSAAIAAGYTDAATVGAAIAAGLAVLAALILPGERISAGARPAMH